MASFIAFSSDDDWFTSNFIFRLFLESCASHCDDSGASREFDKAQATQYLFLYKLDRELARKVVDVMHRTAQIILETNEKARAEQGAAIDPDGQRMYLEEVQRLQGQLDEWAPRYDVI